MEAAIRGNSEPVVLVHGAVLASAFLPLLNEPLMADRFQLIIYYRRRYAGSSRPDHPLSISE